MFPNIHPRIIKESTNKPRSKRNRNNKYPMPNSPSPQKQKNIKSKSPIFTINKIQDNFPEDYKTRRFILLDTETTGLELTTDRLISINAVEMINCELTGMQFNAYLDKRFILNTRPLMYYLSDYNYSRKDNIKKSLRTFLDFVKDDMIITHNASFDMKFINRELNKYGLEEIPLNKCICTLKYFRNLKKIGILDKNFGLKLCDLCRYYNIYVDAKDLHQGIVDTIVFGRVVAKMFEDGVFNYDLMNNNNFNNFNFNEINDLGRSLEDLYISDLNENNDNNNEIRNNNNEDINNDFPNIKNNFSKEKKRKENYKCKSEDKNPKKKLNINFTFNKHKKKFDNRNYINKKNNKINKDKIKKSKSKALGYSYNQNKEEIKNEIFNKSKSQVIDYQEDEEIKINFIKKAFKNYINSNQNKFKEKL